MLILAKYHSTFKMIYFSNHHLTVTLVDDLHTCIIYTSKEPLAFIFSKRYKSPQVI